MQVGAVIEEAGVVLREGDVFYLRREVGGRLRLDLRRTGEDRTGASVRIRGVFVGDDLVDVTSIEAA